MGIPSAGEIKSLLPYRARGLDELKKRVGDIIPLVEKVLRRKGTARILEIGCGFGAVLVELRKRYGERVELTGINKKERHGTWDIMRRVASKRKALTQAQARAMIPPRIVYCDVSKGLPFREGSFDIVYSQVAYQYFDDKIRVIEEVNRVLAPGGEARLHTMFFDPAFPEGYRSLLEIWSRGKNIPLGRFLRRFPSVTWRRSKAGKRFLRIVKARRLDLGLRLVAVINVNDLDKDCWGSKSVYVVGKKKL